MTSFDSAIAVLEKFPNRAAVALPALVDARNVQRFRAFRLPNRCLGADQPGHLGWFFRLMERERHLEPCAYWPRPWGRGSASRRRGSWPRRVLVSDPSGPSWTPAEAPKPVLRVLQTAALAPRNVARSAVALDSHPIRQGAPFAFSEWRALALVGAADACYLH